MLDLDVGLDELPSRIGDNVQFMSPPRISHITLMRKKVSLTCDGKLTPPECRALYISIITSAAKSLFLLLVSVYKEN